MDTLREVSFVWEVIEMFIVLYRQENFSQKFGGKEKLIRILINVALMLCNKVVQFELENHISSTDTTLQLGWL